MSACLRWAWVLCLCVLPCGVARAWTDARARSVDVSVELGEQGGARIAFDVALQVRGGWLEGYEISGLDPDATLDELKPPVLVGEAGEKWAPSARMREGGRLSLAFGRRGAPRRGLYRLRFAYQTQLLPRNFEPTGGDAGLVRWTLPAWRTGLDEAQVWFWTPGTDVRPALVEQGSGRAEVRRLGSRTLLRYHRLHVPRGTPWTIAYERPGTLAVANAGPTSTPWAFGVARRTNLAGAGVSLLLLVALAFVSRRRMGSQVLVVRHPLGSRARALTCASACLVVAGLLTGAAQWGLLALAALACVGVRRRVGLPLRFGAWRRLGRQEQQATRRTLIRELCGAVRYPDPLSLPGLLVLGALGAWVVWDTSSFRPGPQWWGACVALACAHSSLRRGTEQGRALLSLFGLASQLRIEGVSLWVRGFFPPGEAMQQPRLSVGTRAPVSGLLRLEVSTQSCGVGRYVVMATVRASSAADRWLEDMGSHRMESSGRQRACHLWPADDARAVAERLQGLVAGCAARASHAVSRAA